MHSAERSRMIPVVTPRLSDPRSRASRRRVLRAGAALLLVHGALLAAACDAQAPRGSSETEQTASEAVDPGIDGGGPSAEEAPLDPYPGIPLCWRPAPRPPAPPSPEPTPTP